jgi:hypothetical protein
MKWASGSSFRTHSAAGNLPLPAIIPDQMAPIVMKRPSDGQRELLMTRWGLPAPLLRGHLSSRTSATLTLDTGSRKRVNLRRQSRRLICRHGKRGFGSRDNVAGHFGFGPSRFWLSQLVPMPILDFMGSGPLRGGAHPPNVRYLSKAPISTSPCRNPLIVLVCGTFLDRTEKSKLLK